VGGTREVQSTDDLSPKHDLHTTHIFDKNMDDEVRADGLKTPSGKRGGVKVAASVAAEASGARRPGRHSEVLTGRASYQEDAGSERKVPSEVV
jgi:hypothetical protein